MISVGFSSGLLFQNDGEQEAGIYSSRFTHLELGPSIRQAEAFMAAVEGRLPHAAGAATFDDGLASMVILDAIRASAASGGRRVTL